MIAAKSALFSRRRLLYALNILALLRAGVELKSGNAFNAAATASLQSDASISGALPMIRQVDGSANST